MYPVLHAVARLIECPQGDRPGLAAEVADALADEAGLSMVTRLGLVALASRIEGNDAGERTGTPTGSYLPALLEALSRNDEPQAIEALLACAPALRDVAQALGRQRDPYALLPLALLELLASRLH